MQQTEGGYWGKVLRVDLSQGKVSEETLFEAEMKMVLGGSGYGAKVLYQEVPATVQALDPENRIIFALGPFQATKTTGSAKFSIVSRSPVTGIFGETAAGANWAVELKNAGFDALIVQGKAENPVYLSISNDKAEIRDASNMWGKDAFEATDEIRSELGNDKASVACIGQAGEKQVAIACIVVDKHSVGGRCGLGAVMGSKNLKGVVVKGSKRPPVADKKKLADLAKEVGSMVNENTKDWLRIHGTPAVVEGSEEAGDMPIKYWSGDTWKKGAAKIGAPNYTEVLGAKPWPCKFCVVGCHRKVKVDKPKKYAIEEGAGPEYETLGMFGTGCLVDNVKAIAKCNDLCNRYGIDTISAGAFVGFTMECFESGVLNKKDTGGFSITWGDADGMVEMTRQIGKKEGFFGELFANGIAPAAAKLGKGAEGMAMHVKGLDLPAHDPRAFHSLAVNYATGNRGACHERGNPQVASLGALLTAAGIKEIVDPHEMLNSEFVATKYQDYAALTNSLCHCKFMLFGGLGLEHMLDILNAATGWNWSMDEFLEAGERITNIQRMVNVKYGISRKDDTIPERMFMPAKEGGRAGKAPNETSFAEALDRYYELRGWDKDGKPTLSTLSRLKIQL